MVKRGGGICSPALVTENNIAPLHPQNFAFAKRGQDQKLERPRHQASGLFHSSHELGDIFIGHGWVMALDQGPSLGQQDRQCSFPSCDIGLRAQAANNGRIQHRSEARTRAFEFRRSIGAGARLP
jgi:hypothetical protein